jgi:hypothetical protein
VASKQLLAATTPSGSTSVRLQEKNNRRRTRTRRNNWRPILTGEARNRTLDSIQKIVSALPEPTAEDLGSSLSGGAAGLAVLCSYLYRAGLDDNDNAIWFLNRAIEGVSARQMHASLFGGFVGVGWAIAHLQNEFFELEDDPNEGVDQATIDYLKRTPWEYEYDLISGPVGLGVYAFERLPKPSAITCLELVLDRIDELAERTPDGITWFTRPEFLPEFQREQCPKGYYNLGLAHGVPGVIGLLAQLCTASIGLPRAKELLTGAVSWLLSQRRRIDGESTFSSWSVPGTEQRNCRLAWCYGDAGVFSVLNLASGCLQDVAWQSEALEIAKLAAARDPKTTGVEDAGLCHGAAGLAHIFNRLFQSSGDRTFEKSANYWFEQTLELIDAPAAKSGLMEGPSDPRLLTGAAGVALALLAAVTDVEPKWDRFLLLSGRSFEKRGTF